MNEAYQFGLGFKISKLPSDKFETLINYSTGLYGLEKIEYSKRLMSELKHVNALGMSPNYYTNDYNTPIISKTLTSIEHLERSTPEDTVSLVKEGKLLYESDRVLAIAELDILKQYLRKKSEFPILPDDIYCTILQVINNPIQCKEMKDKLDFIFEYAVNYFNYSVGVYIFSYMIYYKLIEYVMIRRIDTGIDDAFSFTMNCYDRYLRELKYSSSRKSDPFASDAEEISNKFSVVIRDIFNIDKNIENNIKNLITLIIENKDRDSSIFDYPDPEYSRKANKYLNDAFKVSSEVKNHPTIETNDYVMMSRFPLPDQEHICNLVFNTTASDVACLSAEEGVSLILSEEERYAMYDAFGTDNFAIMWLTKGVGTPSDRILYRDPETESIYLLYEGDKKIENRKDSVHGIKIYPEPESGEVELLYFNGLDTESSYKIEM